jgi:hypothetical protein
MNHSQARQIFENSADRDRADRWNDIDLDIRKQALGVSRWDIFNAEILRIGGLRPGELELLESNPHFHHVRVDFTVAKKNPTAENVRKATDSVLGAINVMRGAV